jgi:hypothetical protein
LPEEAFQDKELAYFERQIKNYKNKKGVNCEELVNAVQLMTLKAFKTIEVVLKEII